MVYQAKTWGGGGGDLLHYPGCGFMRGHRQMAWGGEPKWSKPIPCLAGGVFIIKHPIRNYNNINAHL